MSPFDFPVNFESFNDTLKEAARDAFEFWGAVSGINFLEVADNGDLLLGTADLGDGSAGRAYYPSTPLAGGDIWLNHTLFDMSNPDDYQFGTSTFKTLLHEIGHALGLEHPGPYDAGGHLPDRPHLPSTQDSRQYTVMSYNHHPGTSAHPHTPMLFDIAAIQYLYGTNPTNNSSSTFYAFGPNFTTNSPNPLYSWEENSPFALTIWDTGGYDTISAAGQTLPAVINLQEGSFSSVGANVNNLAIAYGSDIESAFGGSGNDSLVGNELSNVLEGKAGNDTLLGLENNDTLRGDSHNDTLRGGYGNDLLESGIHDDLLDGGEGNDQLNGGPNLDTVSYDEGYSEFAIGVNVDLSRNTAQDQFGYTDTIYQVENVIGTFRNDQITGDSNNNNLSGLENNDTLVGGSGTDTLYGGEDRDSLLGGLHNDVLLGETGADYLFGDANNDTLHGGSENDTLYGGSDNDTLNGDQGNDTLYGQSGNDSLKGKDHSDVLYGGDNNDTLVGDDDLVANGYADSLYGETGNDTITGGAGNDLLEGGADHDLLSGAGGNDNLNGGAGIDTVYYKLPFSTQGIVANLASGAVQDNYGNQDTLTLIENLEGSDFADDIRGDGLDNLILSHQGNDTVLGASGNDSLLGGDGNDTLRGQDNHDTLYGGLNNDYLHGDAHDDWLYGEGDNDILLGGSGKDFLDGGEGQDQLFGVDLAGINPGAGEIDTLTGGEAADAFILGSRSNAQVFYSSGNSGDLALIKDFIANEDLIHLKGNASQYKVASVAGLGLSFGSSTQADTGIFFTGSGNSELIGVIQDVAIASSGDSAFYYLG